jgi:hypothetical protein
VDLTPRVSRWAHAKRRDSDFEQALDCILKVGQAIVLLSVLQAQTDHKKTMVRLTISFRAYREGLTRNRSTVISKQALDFI